MTNDIENTIPPAQFVIPYCIANRLGIDIVSVDGVEIQDSQLNFCGTFEGGKQLFVCIPNSEKENIYFSAGEDGSYSSAQLPRRITGCKIYGEVVKWLGQNNSEERNKIFLNLLNDRKFPSFVDHRRWTDAEMRNPFLLLIWYIIKDDRHN